MSNIHILYLRNDTILQLDNVQNDVTGGYLVDALVTVTLTDEQGIEVAGDTWPKSMVYIAGSKGMYRTTLPAGLQLQEGRRYLAQVTADGGPGLQGAWDLECVARPRA